MSTFRLLLMRHAKSDWSETGLADHDRPLNSRGQAAAPQMGRWLADHDFVPDVIFASTARRVDETIAGMMSIWTVKPPIYSTKQLYLATPDTILNVIRSDALDHKTVMVVGHNPGMQQLVSSMSESELDFPTAAIAVFDFSIESWARLTVACEKKLVAYVFPKGLDD